MTEGQGIREQSLKEQILLKSVENGLLDILASGFETPISAKELAASFNEFAAQILPGIPPIACARCVQNGGGYIFNYGDSWRPYNGWGYYPHGGHGEFGSHQG